MRLKSNTPLICPSCKSTSMAEKANGSLLYYECSQCNKAFTKEQMQKANSVIFRRRN